nr:hypothetical protein Iba_chr09bCG10390 [Ipomoea batatas]
MAMEVAEKLMTGRLGRRCKGRLGKTQWWSGGNENQNNTGNGLSYWLNISIVDFWLEVQCSHTEKRINEEEDISDKRFALGLKIEIEKPEIREKREERQLSAGDLDISESAQELIEEAQKIRLIHADNVFFSEAFTVTVKIFLYLKKNGDRIYGLRAIKWCSEKLWCYSWKIEARNHTAPILLRRSQLSSAAISAALPEAVLRDAVDTLYAEDDAY